MKRTHAVLAAAIAIAMGFTTASAQSPLGGTTLRCETSDGTILVTASSILVRDIALVPVRVADTGVIELRDGRSGATGELDTRSDEGLYLTVRENGVAMQLIIPRRDITVAEGFASARPADGAERDEAVVNLVNCISSRSIALSR